MSIRKHMRWLVDPGDGKPDPEEVAYWVADYGEECREGTPGACTERARDGRLILSSKGRSHVLLFAMLGLQEKMNLMNPEGE